ncbi:MAG: NAD(P)/FAD-dependent oxidoreductase [Brevinema sp.]
MHYVKDFVIFGGGIYGCYAALKLSQKYPHKKITLIEYDQDIFTRATYINQARLHNGYHYPRSLHTAITCHEYFERFYKEYHFSILDNYTKIYAIAKQFSMASAENFENFCNAANIPCNYINIHQFFNPEYIEVAYKTLEYTIDMLRLKQYFQEQITTNPNIQLITNFKLKEISSAESHWIIKSSDHTIETDWVLNTTYSSLNTIIKNFGFEPIPLKYELTEMVLCTVPNALQNYGLTVMDGPFFSLMPFDFQGLFSLSSVRYTPHETSFTDTPKFSCQQQSSSCSEQQTDNCSACPVRPNTAWPHMFQLTKKYLKSYILPEYNESLYTIKALMKSSSLSDSRPVIIKQHNDSPCFISILGGKINTIYEMDSFL